MTRTQLAVTLVVVGVAGLLGGALSDWTMSGPASAQIDKRPKLRIPREGGTPLTLPDRTRPGPELSLPLAEYVDPNDPSNNLTGDIVELRGFVGRMHTYAASEHNICQAELLPTHEVLSMEPRPGDRTEVVMLLTDDHWLQDALFQGQRIKHKQRSPGRIMVLGQRIDISDWSEVFPYSELPVRHPRQDMYYIYSVSLIP